MATRLHQRLAATTVKPRRTTARDWRATIADSAFRQRAHGIALMLMSVAGVCTGMLVIEARFATLVAAGVGVYGAHLWRR